MSGQQEAHPSVVAAISSLRKSNPQSEFVCLETQKEHVQVEVKKMLIAVCSTEEYFQAKFEVATVGRAS